jgi:hypothetical protein
VRFENKNIFCYFEKPKDVADYRIVTHDRCFRSWSQSYDFKIYNYNAGVVVG